MQRLTAPLKALEEQATFALRAAGQEFDAYARELPSPARGSHHGLKGEIARLKQQTKQKRTLLFRIVGSHGDKVGAIARQMLKDWGVMSMKSLYVDSAACDLVIYGRRRLTLAEYVALRSARHHGTQRRIYFTN